MRALLVLQGVTIGYLSLIAVALVGTGGRTVVPGGIFGVLVALVVVPLIVVFLAWDIAERNQDDPTGVETAD